MSLRRTDLSVGNLHAGGLDHIPRSRRPPPGSGFHHFPRRRRRDGAYTAGVMRDPPGRGYGVGAIPRVRSRNVAIRR